MFKLFGIFKYQAIISWNFKKFTSFKKYKFTSGALVLFNYFMENDTALYTPVNKVSIPATIKSRHIGLDRYSTMS